jgi:hypothetical protein
MKPDEPTPPAGQPTPDTPPASLTAVRIGRRKVAPPAGGKAGDLTRQLGTDTPSDAEAAARPDPAVASMPPVVPATPPVRGAAEPPAAKAAPAPAPESPRAAAPAPAAKPPRAVALPSSKSARLLGEEEIRQLLDPPERRAAVKQPAPPPAIAGASERPAVSAPTAKAPAAPPAPPTPAPAPPAMVDPEPPTVVEPPSLMIEPDEREAVPPAPAAPELRLVAETPPPAKAEVPAERPSAGGLPTTIDQIIDYWDSLRGGKPVPPLDALDRGLVRRSWPNCMLVAYGGAPKLTRIGEENGEIEYLEMVIHWILSRGQVTASRGEPMEEEKRFPVSDGNARYQLLLLPLANAEGKSEHVLCHLLRVKEAAKPKGFKRWLAS